jgi:Domain of unknown function (DUF4145)
MLEVYLAANNRFLRLAAMGIRAMVETVMKEKVGDYPFTVLVDKFQEAGYLSTRQAGSLSAIIEAGHAATHRGWEPTESEITTCLEITEALIEDVYFHENDARTLDKRVPKRLPRVRES